MSTIPAHLILGFLGVGKSTAILDLMQRRPEGERWAVLVNEFGEVGVDGALMEAGGVAVREVPGGCMCCVAGLPMQVALNELIRRERPDRLLIEPTGLGHPSQVIDTLTGGSYEGVLHLQSVLCLVDPRRLQEERVLNNVHFRDQAAVADVVVANKCDLCTDADRACFHAWAAGFQPPKALVGETARGQLALEWLTQPRSDRPASDPHAHDHHHEAGPSAPTPLTETPWQQFCNSGDGHYSCGWRLSPDYCFDHQGLVAFCHGSHWRRIKGVMRTDDGWVALNMADGALSEAMVEPSGESRLEVIMDEPPDAQALDQRLGQLLVDH
ncbi:CobW family GTP-binding protein [Halomonadaceae bacterium KBTZ08]